MAVDSWSCSYVIPSDHVSVLWHDLIYNLISFFGWEQFESEALSSKYQFVHVHFACLLKKLLNVAITHVVVNLFRTPSDSTLATADLKQRLIDLALPRDVMLMCDLCETFCASVALLLRTVMWRIYLSWAGLTPWGWWINRTTLCHKSRKMWWCFCVCIICICLCMHLLTFAALLVALASNLTPH